jgi:hypothetical protein
MSGRLWEAWEAMGGMGGYGRHGRLWEAWEAMGGMGGFPPNFLYFHFSYGYFRGEPPVPSIASLLSFLLSFYFLK